MVEKKNIFIQNTLLLRKTTAHLHSCRQEDKALMPFLVLICFTLTYYNVSSYRLPGREFIARFWWYHPESSAVQQPRGKSDPGSWQRVMQHRAAHRNMCCRYVSLFFQRETTKIHNTTHFCFKRFAFCDWWRRSSHIGQVSIVTKWCLQYYLDC